MAYNREQAVAYARQWAFARNPRFSNFDAMGGDCTNFISQCLYAGSGVMNHTPQLGWYYYSLSQRSPSWTGVPFLYNFLVANHGPGPYGEAATLANAEPGDVIQLNFSGAEFGHSLLVVAVGQNPAPDNILIATHTLDAYNRPLSTYTYLTHRLIHVLGARG